MNRDDALELIKYLRGLGIDVRTSTKARGHQGFYLHNRIDISKNIAPEREIPTILHEFAHYIHSKIEPFMERSGGSLEIIFDDNNPNFYKNEIEKITNTVDINSKCEKLLTHKGIIKDKILEQEKIIKSHYPQFQRSKKFPELEKYIKKTNAKYLLKYDRVKIISNGKSELLSIENVEENFSQMPEEFLAYIRLRSFQRKQAKVSSRISRLKKYYSRPTELFARFVEGLYIKHDQVKELAPNCYKRFFELLDAGYYREMFGIKELLQAKNCK
ncbi:hypothetical protein IJ579_08565 [bacterium]|nr:hypothetical protein [bacterium]